MANYRSGKRNAQDEPETSCHTKHKWSYSTGVASKGLSKQLLADKDHLTINKNNNYEWKRSNVLTCIFVMAEGGREAEPGGSSLCISEGC